MPIDIRSNWGQNKAGKSDINEQVVDSAEVLLKCCEYLSRLVSPKTFRFSSFALLKFERTPTDGSKHGMRIMLGGDDNYLPTVDETIVWQVFGYVGNVKDRRTVNVIIRHILHTFKGDRSGTGETFINGKPLWKPEYGGLTVDDIWQDTELYKKEYADAQSFYTYKGGKE